MLVILALVMKLLLLLILLSSLCLESFNIKIFRALRITSSQFNDRWSGLEQKKQAHYNYTVDCNSICCYLRQVRSGQSFYDGRVVQDDVRLVLYERVEKIEDIAQIEPRRSACCFLGLWGRWLLMVEKLVRIGRRRWQFPVAPSSPEIILSSSAAAATGGPGPLAGMMTTVVMVLLLVMLTRGTVWHEVLVRTQLNDVQPVLGLICCDDFRRRIDSPVFVVGGLDLGGHGLDRLLGPGDGHPISIVDGYAQEPAIPGGFTVSEAPCVFV